MKPQDFAAVIQIAKGQIETGSITQVRRVSLGWKIFPKFFKHLLDFNKILEFFATLGWLETVFEIFHNMVIS